MPKIRYLKVQFANPIFPAEIPYFRAAVIEATQRESSLFHNHTDDKGVIYRYPLIQYKVTERKASIICIEQGTDDIHYLFQQRDLKLRIGEREESFTIEDIHLQYFNIQLWQSRLHYALKDWQALNQENYQRYLGLLTEVERLQMLEGLLRGNLLALATGIGWQVPAPIEVGITRLKEERRLRYKGQPVLCFSLNFHTNVSLPEYVGLGKGVSVGFGGVRRMGEERVVDDNRMSNIL
ncbi:MAG TPA: CRISPR-associated endonuclease Cas6 [Saprospiraceae bacterium]|nr:CRISPR-associated endonuclease Cas6 [Saprospiraceae bacterium]